jgi:hypothetical protein
MSFDMLQFKAVEALCIECLVCNDSALESVASLHTRDEMCIET